MLRSILFLASLAFAAPAAAQSASDFRLPTEPSPTQSTRAQGPVDEESGPLLRVPRVISTETPTPVPQTSTPAPVRTTPAPAASQTPGSAGQQPRSQPVLQQNPRTVLPPVASTAEAPVQLPVEAPIAGPGQTSPFPSYTPSPATATPQAEPDAPAESETTGWLYAMLGGLVVVAAAGVVVLRRRSRSQQPLVVERPVVAGAQASAPEAPLADVLTLRVEATRMTRSFAFATVDYRLTLVNRTAAALLDLSISTDLTSAHAAAPVESQLASSATQIEVRHHVDRLGPNQTVRLEGQVRLPLGEAQVIRQGSVPLLVPLLRVRVARDAASEGALVKTLVVGQGQPGGGRVQPFNLADAPRAYTQVAQRELA